MSLLIGTYNEVMEVNNYDYQVTNFSFVTFDAEDEGMIDLNFDLKVEFELIDNSKHDLKLKNVGMIEKLSLESSYLESLDKNDQKEVVFDKYSDEIRDYVEELIINKMEEL